MLERRGCRRAWRRDRSPGQEGRVTAVVARPEFRTRRRTPAGRLIQLQTARNFRLFVRATFYAQDKAAKLGYRWRWPRPLCALWRKEESLLMQGFEPSGFHTVSANLHVAPAAGMIFAGIEEQPAAIRFFAGP